MDRHPSVAVRNRALRSLLRFRAQQHRWSAFLHRLRITPDRIEVNELAVILCCFLGPNLLHCLNALAQYLPSTPEIGAMIFHLLAIPTAADSENYAAVRDHVERRDLLRQQNRIALDDETDSSAELDPLGGDGRRGQCDELVVRVPILGRQI